MSLTRKVIIDTATVFDEPLPFAEFSFRTRGDIAVGGKFIPQFNVTEKADENGRLEVELLTIANSFVPYRVRCLSVKKYQEHLFDLAPGGDVLFTELLNLETLSQDKSAMVNAALLLDSIIAAHEAKADPHTQYLNMTRGDDRYGRKSQADALDVSVNGAKASGQIKFLVNPTVGDSFSNFTFQTNPTAPTHIQIGSTIAETAASTLARLLSSQMGMLPDIEFTSNGTDTIYAKAKTGGEAFNTVAFYGFPFNKFERLNSGYYLEGGTNGLNQNAVQLSSSNGENTFPKLDSDDRLIGSGLSESGGVLLYNGEKVATNDSLGDVNFQANGNFISVVDQEGRINIQGQGVSITADEILINGATFENGGAQEIPVNYKTFLAEITQNDSEAPVINRVVQDTLFGETQTASFEFSYNGTGVFRLTAPDGTFDDDLVLFLYPNFAGWGKIERIVTATFQPDAIEFNIYDFSNQGANGLLYKTLFEIRKYIAPDIGSKDE